MKSHDFSSPCLFVCITDVFEVFTDGGERKVEVKPQPKLELKFIEVGRAVSIEEGLDKLETQ